MNAHKNVQALNRTVFFVQKLVNSNNIDYKKFSFVRQFDEKLKKDTISGRKIAHLIAENILIEVSKNHKIKNQLIKSRWKQTLNIYILPY